MLTRTLLALLMGGEPTLPAEAVATEVTKALQRRELVTTSLTDCTEEFSSFEVSRDKQGVIRRLVRAFGSEDSSHRAENFYDARGRLRLVAVTVRAVPSAWVEARFWLDEAGRVTKTKRKQGGEGHTGYATELGDYGVKEPQRLLDARTRCDAG
jgi:hypothetical protein